MARASAVTKLSLDRWAQLMGLHPLHFNGVTVADLAAATNCHIPWLQYSWQDADRVGREDVANAIALAEATIEDLLGYRLLPSWEVEEWKATIRPYHPEEVYVANSTVRGYRQIVPANWGYFLYGGEEAKVLISAGAAIVYSDADADGWSETATVAVGTTVTDEDEIAVYYPGKSGDDAWEIRPISVVIAGGVATITFKAYQAVIEARMEALDAQGVDGTDATAFLTTVDVYRHYNDPSQQATLLWEPTGSCDCGSTTCTACSYSTQTACLALRGDPKLSLVSWSSATWDAVAENFVAAAMALERAPDAIKLWYKAGLLGKGRNLDTKWERVVANYAASLLERPICECGNPHDYIDKMATDLAFTSGAGELSSYNISQSDLDNPLGTRRGAVLAWKQVRDAALVRSVDA